MFKNYIRYHGIMTTAFLNRSRPVFHINTDFGTTFSKTFEFFSPLDIRRCTSDLLRLW
jgi:hypothetical protein